MSERQTTEEWAAEWGRRERAMSEHTPKPLVNVPPCVKGCGGHHIDLNGIRPDWQTLCPTHAAAPDMLEALRNIIERLDAYGTLDTSDGEANVEAARAIIRKATNGGA